MKKLYFLLFTFLICGLSFGQGTETFDNFPSTSSSYVDGTFLGQDGSTWTFIQCRGDASITGQSIMLGRSRTPQAEFYSGIISGGVGTITFNYMQAFSTNVNLNVLVNGAVAGNVTSSGEQNVIKSSGTITVNQPGDVVIKFINVNNSDGQVVIDDVVWTGYAGVATPTLSVVDGPANGESFNLTSSEASGDVTWETTNFVVDTEPNGDGYIHFTVTDDDTMDIINDINVYDTSTPTNYGPLTSGHTYSFVAELLNYDGSSLDPAVIFDVTGTVLFPPTNAMVITGVFDVLNGSTPKGIELYVLENIADLSIFGVGSANNGGGTNGEEFTFPSVSANQGDFIYIVGTGQLTDFNNFFENSITAYGSDAMFINGDDAIELFENGEVIDLFGDINYSGSQPWFYTDGWAYRSNNTGPDGSSFDFANWTLSGTGTLDGATNAVSTNPFPIGTYMNTLATSDFEINSLKLYPNPTSLGYVNITSKNQTAMKVGVYDILGKQVINETVSNNRLDVSTLTTGIYIMKISQDDATTTRKLIIK